MEPLQKYIEISSAFSKFVKTGERGQIERYCRNDIELTMLHFQQLKGSERYQAMENRVAELKALEVASKEKKYKRKIKLIVSICSLLAATLLYFIVIAVLKS